ncbi:MAG: hypothetical protein ACXACA_07930, partial [Candidatus Ranarchaeia archaeon]
SHDITDQNEIVSLDVVDQGAVTDIMIITRYNGSRIFRDDGSAMTIVSELYNYYNDSIDHHFANIDNTPESEIVLVVHNSLVVFTSEGTIIESHSLPKEIIAVIDWKVDSTMKVAFVTILNDNTLAVADPSSRIMFTQNGEAATSNLKEASVSEQAQVRPTNSIGSTTPTLELTIPIFLTIFTSLTIFSGIRKRRQNVRNRRRSQL